MSTLTANKRPQKITLDLNAFYCVNECLPNPDLEFEELFKK